MCVFVFFWGGMWSARDDGEGGFFLSFIGSHVMSCSFVVD